MKLNRLYRLAILGAIASSLITAAACSDDDKNNGGTSTPDSGVDSAVPPPVPDASTDAAVKPAKININMAHAMPNVGPIQLCFGVGTAPNLSFPLPDPQPTAAAGGALPPGAGGALPLEARFLPLLSTVNITPFAFPAEKVTAGATCANVIAGNGGVPADEVYALTPIPQGTLKLDHSYLLAFLGCRGGEDASAGAAICGPGYTGASNVRSELVELDGVSNSTTDNGFQFVHLSPETAAAFGFAFNEPSVQAQLVEGTTVTNIGSPATFALQPTPTPATAVRSATALSSPVANGIKLATGSDGGAFPIENPLFFNLDTIAQMSTGTADAGYFAKGENYTILLIGNPSEPNPTDPHGLRIVAVKSSLPK